MGAPEVLIMVKHALAAFTFSAGLLITSATANAADPEIAVFDWTGFYAGLQAGYGSDSHSDIPWGNPGGPLTNNDGPLKADGFLAGLYAGYNHQMDQVVLGLEADINYFDFKGDDEDRGGDTNGVAMDWQGNLRARVGFAMDNTLFYGAGGWAHMSGDGTVRNDPGTPIFQRVSTSFNGWTAGVGIEHAFTENLLARIEYRYTDYSLSVESYGGYDLGFEPEIHTVMVGFGYKF
jgi:outer membrane immunogenic protein